jgi:uncharacterized membrane protein
MGKRIVINLDAPQGGSSSRGQEASKARRRRWPRVLALLSLFLIVFLVVGAAGAFFWWRHYQSTPAYSLALLVDAAQRNDTAELQKLINEDEIAKNMVTTVSQKAASRYGYALNSSIQQRIDSSMSTLSPRLKQTVRDEVVKEIQVFASKSERRPFIFLIVTGPSLLIVTTEGDTAKVKAPMSDRAIELTMQRNADRWQVTDVKDDVVIQRVVDNVMKELPAIGTSDLADIFKKPKRNRSRRGR